MQRQHKQKRNTPAAPRSGQRLRRGACRPLSQQRPQAHRMGIGIQKYRRQQKQPRQQQPKQACAVGCPVFSGEQRRQPAQHRRNQGAGPIRVFRNQLADVPRQRANQNRRVQHKAGQQQHRTSRSLLCGESAFAPAPERPQPRQRQSQQQRRLPGGLYQPVIRVQRHPQHQLRDKANGAQHAVGCACRKALLAARLLTVGHGASGLTGSSEPACHHGCPRPLSRKRRMRPCARSRLSGLAT